MWLWENKTQTHSQRETRTLWWSSSLIQMWMQMQTVSRTQTQAVWRRVRWRGRGVENGW